MFAGNNLNNPYLILFGHISYHYFQHLQESFQYTILTGYAHKIVSAKGFETLTIDLL